MSESVSFISKEELAASLADRKYKLIDVRLNWGTSQTKLPSAVHEEPDDVAAWASKYDTAAPIVLYCSSPEQKTSCEAAQELLNQGFENVRVLQGGWAVWNSTGLPVQKRNQGPAPKGVVKDVLKD